MYPNPVLTLTGRLLSNPLLLIPTFVPQMQVGIATIAYDKMNNDEMAVKYVKKALQTYTDQGNYAGVALARQKLKQNSPKS